MTMKNKIPYILLSLLISVMLWFYVVGVEKPETEEVISGIKVVLEGEEELKEDRHLVLTSDRVITVSLKFRGNMIDIANLIKKKDQIVVTADLYGITTPGFQRLAYDIESLPVDNVTLLERLPFYIDLKIEKVQSTPVDIICKNEGSIAEGFLSGEPEITPTTLQVSGPEEIINSIAYAEVVWSRENISRTITADLEFNLIDKNGDVISKDGITSNYEFVTVTMPVQKTKEINLIVLLNDGGGATDENIIYEISPKTITVAGEPANIDALNSITLGTIDLAKIINPGEIEFPIIVPNDVVNLSGEISAVVEIVEITGLSMREIVCNDISVINIPDGYEAEIITKQITVRIRGNKEYLDLVNSYDLRAVADLEGAAISEGKYSVSAKMVVDRFTNVGIVGEYKIVLEITDKET